MPEGIITIKLEGATFKQTEVLREMIHTMFEQGVFAIKNGSATLNFDELGQLGSIELNIKKWRRGKPDFAIAKIYKDVKIEMTQPLMKAGQ